ncbi:MAG: tripartite tricarboxylate transporter TctB family protein [Deltaproteobacteria bacterium]|nr:tripartite tricarboxylate transporter TctB family protein [Deltaproteobacteria bacterium]MBM4298506.1 tripartite tricarboxylate transporter TctB family protein [Deltaproteobacteria bacterium]
MRAAEVITASLLALFGALVLFDATRLGIGWGSDGPKSGFFPFWLALIMVASCIVIVVQALRQTQNKPFIDPQALPPVLKVLWPAFAAVLLMQWIGLYAASAIYLAFYMRWVGRQSWGAVIALSLAIPVLSFFVFEKWFLVPMPKGPLEAWLGY